jgi:SAM-dependent methyltransferase
MTHHTDGAAHSGTEAQAPRTPSISAATANAAQTALWNGQAGDHRITHRERHEAQYRAMTERLLAACAIEAGHEVLDVGCGCGETTLRAALAARDGRAFGVDLSAPMLAEARRLAGARGVGNTAFIQSDAQVHPFPDEAFDVVLSRFGVMFFADPAAAFANLARALRPGGRLAFLCWQAETASDYMALTSRSLAPYLPVPPEAGPHEPGPFSLADPLRVRALLDGAGFGQVRADPVIEPLWVGKDLDDALAYRFDTPTGRALIAAVDEASRAGAVEALRAAYRPYLAADGVTLEGAAWLVTANRPS